MGLVINPRGTSGAGRTELVRRIVTEYRLAGGEAEPLWRPGRPRPIGWRIGHPGAGRPLAVIGHYEATRGGCDTIPDQDGGLDGAFRLADALAQGGHDVLIEGLRLSGDHCRTAALARVHRVHVLHLDTPLDACARNVTARRRAGRGALAAIERTVGACQDALAAACEALRRDGVAVERLPFDAALGWARALLAPGVRPVCCVPSSITPWRVTSSPAGRGRWPVGRG
jgi:hypothetical protein